MVVVILEENCSICSRRLSATIEIADGQSRTTGDFNADHAVDVQAAGPDRVLKAIHVAGRCGSCGTTFSYKAFSVMQSHGRGEMAPGQ